MIIQPRDFHFRPGEIEIGRHDEHAVDARGHNLVGNRRRAEQRFVQTFAFEFLQPERTGRVALWIEIDDQDAQALLRESAPEIYSSRRFSDAPFLVRDRDDLHSAGTIWVRSSKVRRPSFSCQSKCSGSGNISVTSNSPAFVSQP